MLLILLLISISALPLYSQNDATPNSSESKDLNEMKNAIEKERISQVNELMSQDKLAEIESLFASDEEAYFTLIKENDTQYADFVREMMFKAYRNISSLQDDLLFLDCKKAMYSNNWDMTALKANDLIRRYPDSSRKSIAIRYWKLALFKSGKDQEYIALVDQYPEFDLASQKFQYGQALYNVGNFDSAKQHLEDAASDNEYGLRSLATLGLVAFAQGNREESKLIFDALEKNYTVKTPYYDYVLLTKARLLSYDGDTANAIKYYQAYNKLNATAADEVAYEIAITHRKAGNLEKAKGYFEHILKSKFADEYYVQALYNLVLIDQELNNGQATNELMVNYQSRVDDYFDSLLKNRNLMNEVRTLRNNFLMENEQSSKTILLEQIRAKESEIIANQVALDEKISFLDVKSIQLIKDLELSFLERTETYFVELDLIDKYRNQDKKSLVDMANEDRLAKEEGYLWSITDELLKDITDPTEDQFIRAYWYSNQIYLKKKYIVNVSNLIDKTKSYPEQNAKLRGLLAEEQVNIDEIKVKAKFDLAEFPNLSERQELAEQKVDEFLAVESKLEKKRQNVIDSYYEIMANKAQKEVVDKFKDLDNKINSYTNSFTKFNTIKNDQQNYVDFIALDLEFRKLNQAYKLRLEQTQSDSLSISEEEFAGMVRQRENLYGRTNNFVFKNNKFENNAKLYFNLAELTTFTNTNDYNLIYDHYKTVLELDPNFSEKDVVIYNLAYHKSLIIDKQIGDIKDELMKDPGYFVKEKPNSVIKDTEKYSEVIKYYLVLMKDKDSSYQIEAMFRLAKLYFDIAVDSNETALYIENAIKIYGQIYELGNTNQKMEALFESAWHKMSIGKHLEAIQDIQTLMAQKSQFNEEQANKYDTSGEIIAYSLNSLDGDDTAEYNSSQFVANDLFSNFDEETANSIFNKLIYRKQLFDLYKDIVSLYNARSLVNPNAITNPAYIDSIIVTLGSYSVEIGDSLNVWGEREYRRAYDRYGFNSEWYEYNKDKDIAPYVKVIQKGLDDFIIPGVYKEMVANPSLENITKFSKIVGDYADYKGFNEEIRAKKMSLYDSNTVGALTAYVIQNPDTTSYRMGIKEVYKYIDRNPNIKDRKDLEQNAYRWALSITVITDSIKTDSLLYSPIEQENIKNKARTEYLEIADRFYNYLATSDFPDKDDTIHRLLYYRGLRKFQTGDNEGARADFLACDSLNISDEFKEGIYRNLADIYKEKGDYDTSTEYFAKAKTYAKKESFEGYEIAIFNNRQAKVTKLNKSDNKEDKIKAAKEMEIILESSVVSDEKKIKIKRDAITLYAEGGDYDTAISRLIAEGDKSQDIGFAWDNYGSAISIADSLGKKDKTVEIENRFMERFPADQQTFVILAQRLATVSDSTSTSYNPLVASEKSREIYNRASQKEQKLDISSGNLSLDDYYFNSIELKCRVISKAEQVAEWVDFRNKFPNYQTIPILNNICKLYEELGQKEKYLEYIKILYAVDSTNPLYPSYAIEKLSVIDKEIFKQFRKKEWKDMLKNISLYQETANKFTSDGIPAELIAVPQALEKFANYTMVYEREQEKKELLSSLEKNFNRFMEFIAVSQNDDSRVKVNTATAWNKNLEGENGRIKTFDKLAKKQFELIEKEIEKVMASDLLNSQEIREQIFLLDYANFKTAKYVGDTIFNQIDKYLIMPNGQYVDYENKVLARTDISYEEQDELLFQYESDIKAIRSQYFLDYGRMTIEIARSMYNLYINGFTEQLSKSTEIMAFLKENAVAEAKAQEEMIVPFTPATRKDFASITQSSYNDKYRDLAMYNIPSGETLLIESTINCPIFPMASRLRVINEDKFWEDDKIKMTVKFNDTAIDLESARFADGVIEDSLSAYPYLQRNLNNFDNSLTNDFLEGNNKITISIKNDSFQATNVALLFSMIYDQEKLYIHNNSVIVSVISDNSWLGAESIQALNITDENWKPVNYGTVDVDFYQLNVFKSSTAIPIWLNSENETTKVAKENEAVQSDTSAVNQGEIEAQVTKDSPVVRYFIKEFEVAGEVVDCTINLLANETANIFLNGEQIGFDVFYFFAPPDSPDLDIDPESFVIGKNVLIIEVNSPSQNNGLLVDMKIKTLNKRR